MISLIPYKQERPLSILAMGAHCDDIEIGCGGTLLTLARNNPDIHITWIVFSSTEKRKLEATEAANLYCRVT